MYCETFFTADMNSATQNTKMHKLSCSKLEPSRNCKFFSAEKPAECIEYMNSEVF